MKTQNLYFIASLSILIPITGRLGFGIVILLGLISINIFSALLLLLLKKLKIEEFETPLHIFSVIALTIIFKELLRCFSPILSFNIHFSLYLVCFSSFLFLSDSKNETKLNLSYFLGIIKKSFLFSLFGLFFIALREYAAYASLSVPIKEGLYVISLPAIHLFNGSFFWSSTAFALVLLAIILIVVSTFQKAHLIKRISK